MSRSGWVPRWSYNDRIARSLMEIARASAAVEQHAWSPIVEEEIRFRARLRSTHFSTRIEGNRLTLAEAEQVIRDRRVQFAGRRRDVKAIRAADVMEILPLSDRAVRTHLAHRVDIGFLVVHNASNRGRRYELSEAYRKYIGRLSEANLDTGTAGA